MKTPPVKVKDCALRRRGGKNRLDDDIARRTVSEHEGRELLLKRAAGDTGKSLETTTHLPGRRGRAEERARYEAIDPQGSPPLEAAGEPSPRVGVLRARSRHGRDMSCCILPGSASLGREEMDVGHPSPPGRPAEGRRLSHAHLGSRALGSAQRGR